MKYGHFDDTEREYVIDRPDTPAPWVNFLRNMEQLFPIMQAVTVLQSQAQMEGSCATFSTALISLADIFTSVITSLRITGLPPGSRWAKTLTIIKVNVITVWAIPG